ncbi:hypothetical protein [Calidifontibacillus erzurumensis]|nr:hypothetical protein [Calidifontibacillus erzurumensis]
MMILVVLYGLLTIFCVIFAIRKRKVGLLVLPFATIFAYMLIKIIMVPLPFWDTVQFIFGLR